MGCKDKQLRCASAMEGTGQALRKVGSENAGPETAGFKLHPFKNRKAVQRA